MTDKFIPIRVIPSSHELVDFNLTTLKSSSTPIGKLEDRLHRPLQDLRISVTDRCNFRCTYCMPKEVFDSNYAYLPQSDLLSFEEITRLASEKPAVTKTGITDRFEQE